MMNTTDGLTKLADKVMNQRSERETRQNKQMQNLKQSLFILLVLIVMAFVSVSDGRSVMSSENSSIQQQK